MPCVRVHETCTGFALQASARCQPHPGGLFFRGSQDMEVGHWRAHRGSPHGGRRRPWPRGRTCLWVLSWMVALLCEPPGPGHVLALPSPEPCPPPSSLAPGGLRMGSCDSHLPLPRGTTPACRPVPSAPPLHRSLPPSSLGPSHQASCCHGNKALCTRSPAHACRVGTRGTQAAAPLGSRTCLVPLRSLLGPHCRLPVSTTF